MALGPWFDEADLPCFEGGDEQFEYALRASGGVRGLVCWVGVQAGQVLGLPDLVGSVAA